MIDIDMTLVHQEADSVNRFITVLTQMKQASKRRSWYMIGLAVWLGINYAVSFASMVRDEVVGQGTIAVLFTIVSGYCIFTYIETDAELKFQATLDTEISRAKGGETIKPVGEGRK